MFSLKTVLRTLGVNVSDEHIEQLELLIPQIPSKANELITAIGVTITNFDKRLQILEVQNDEYIRLQGEILKIMVQIRDQHAEYNATRLNEYGAIMAELKTTKQPVLVGKKK